MTPVWVGCDHGGYQLKTAIIAELEKQGVDFVDVGTNSTEIVRYPFYAAKVASAVSRGTADRGILICSTGIGMSIIANRYRGVRASLCTTGYMGRMTRAHNNSNVLCLGGRITGDLEAIDILHERLTTDFEGGRHEISLGMIADAEGHMSSGDPWTTDDPMLDSKGH